MSRFLRDDHYLIATKRSTSSLVPRVYPVQADKDHYFGSWVVTETGNMYRVLEGDWLPFFPPGAEVFIAPWSPIPEGWFEVDVTLPAEYDGHKVITNVQP